VTWAGAPERCGGKRGASITIRVALEAAPVVWRDFGDDGDERRMRDWLDAHPDYWELIDRAVELIEQERAA
jgi:hypothetical protein